MSDCTPKEQADDWRAVRWGAAMLVAFLVMRWAGCMTPRQPPAPPPVVLPAPPPVVPDQPKRPKCPHCEGTGYLELELVK